MSYKKSNPNGQATMANSEPVVIASDQASIPVTVSGVATSAKQDTIIGHIDGVETLIGTTNSTLTTIDSRVDGLETLVTSTNTKLDTVNTNLTTIDGRVDGLETSNSAIQTAVQLIDDAIFTDDTSTHATGTSKGMAIMAVANPTDAAVDANDFGVPAMTLARALKNDITSIAGTASAVGSGNATGALRVELPTNGTGVIATVNALGTGTTGPMKAEDVAHATGDMGIPAWGVRNDNAATTYGADQDYIPITTDLKGRTSVRQTAPTGTRTNVASSATSVTLVSADSARIGGTIANDSTQILYINLESNGTAASTSNYTYVLPAVVSSIPSVLEIPAGYTGSIQGIWASANGNARVTIYT